MYIIYLIILRIKTNGFILCEHNSNCFHFIFISISVSQIQIKKYN